MDTTEKKESCAEDHRKYMRRAIELSRQGMERGGGPFGAVIVKEGRILGEASNAVALHNDPTAHAEVEAIRAACAGLGTFDLRDAVIYTSCEPCPMCLGAIYWARIGRIYYANDRADAARTGFDDSFIYDQIALPAASRSIPMEQVLHDEALPVFEQWVRSENKTEY